MEVKPSMNGELAGSVVYEDETIAGSGAGSAFRPACLPAPLPEFLLRLWMGRPDQKELPRVSFFR